MASKPLSSPIQLFKHYTGEAARRYRNLHILGKIFIWLVVLFYICLALFIIIVTPARIAQFLYDYARLLAKMRFGWLIIGSAITIISFPPLVGHTTLMQLCGFAYGIKGFYIASVASIVGSALAFVTLRYFFRERLRYWSARNTKWQALEEVVRAKGLPLIILIRISPFPPWVYSNSLFASIESVSLYQFLVATLFICPKLLLHAFIGSRLAALSDGKQRDHMDTQTKIINSCLVGGGVIIAMFASWLVYTLVQKHIRHLEGFPPEVDELAAEALENPTESEPLLSGYTV